MQTELQRGHYEDHAAAYRAHNRRGGAWRWRTCCFCGIGKAWQMVFNGGPK